MLMQNRASPGKIPAHAETMARKSGPVLIFELRVDSRWQLLAIQTLADQPGTISNNHDGIRDIYLMQLFEDRATISVLPLGIDVEQGLDRTFDPDEVKLAQVMHTLTPGQSIELTVRPDRISAPVTVRYRYEAKTN